jgi:outer membrane protein assembly factor BamB
MKMGDGHIKQEDLLWLESQLENGKLESDELIAITHYPLSEGLDNWFNATSILKSYGCRVAFCGHGHRLSLFNFDGIPGIMGRTALSGRTSEPGYCIVKLRNDSVLVYNKELSISNGKPSIAMNYIKAENLSQIPVSPVPDFSMNKAYTNLNIVAEFSDTASIFSGPCLVKDTLLVYGNSLGWVKAINTVSGQIQWQIKLDGPVYSTPLEAGGSVILGTVDGFVIGLNAVNGRQLWNVRTGRPVLAEGIIEDGFVYIGGGDRSFYKIDILNGNIIWQFDSIEGLIQGKPALSGSSVIFGAWDRHLYCLDKNSGSLKWKWNNGKPQELYSPGNVFPVCSDGKVFIVAPDRFMTAIDINTGIEIWRTGRHQVRESMGASPDGSLIYAKLMNDTVIAVSASGKFPVTKWAVNAGFGYEHNPCPVTATGSEVIAATRNGVLVAINPETQKVIWKYKAGNSSVNKVITGKDNTLWFTLTEGKIVGVRTIIKP